MMKTSFDDRPLALHIQALNVAYGERIAVRDVDAVFPLQTITAIVGPNGAGKSTMLKAALGIVPSLSGQVTIFGKPFSQIRHKVAYVPQRVSVDWDFPAHVFDVVMMGLYPTLGLLKRINHTHKERVFASLERVGMAEFAQRQIGELSGGQQQRVFLARALVQNADLYLLDEPFAGVDATTERVIIDLLKSLRDDGKTSVCVHHDLSTVQEYFDRVFMMNVSKVAEGETGSTFNAANVQATYGGRLIHAHVESLNFVSSSA